jgi:uncharacterized protein YbcV (DUF1398 family)
MLVNEVWKKSKKEKTEFENYTQKSSLRGIRTWTINIFKVTMTLREGHHS